jgi:hypothetical protein
MELKSAKSNIRAITFAYLLLAFIYCTAFYDFLMSLAPNIIVPLRRASSSTVSLPIPVFPPATTITLLRIS